MRIWRGAGTLAVPFRLTVLVLAVPAGPGCAGNPAAGDVSGAASAASRPTTEPASTEALRIVELVNIYRASLGLRPLDFHPAVAAVAQAHAEAIAAGREPYSHAGLDDRVAAIARRIRHQAVAENLASAPANRPAPMERAVERWILSDPHRRALAGCYELTGVGVARSPNGIIYLSQLFVQRALAQPSEARLGQDLEMARCR